MSPLESIFDALDRSGVRYVVVGGVAVVLHGFARLTADLDLVVDLRPNEARRVIEALQALGLRPRVPVDPLDFADSDLRQTWIREKHMRVFTMIDPGNPLRQVDLFVEHPIPFDDLFQRAELVDLGTATVRVASIEDLLTLKLGSGRGRDLADVEALREIQKRRRKT
jgi:predicted nucleotidyltransferase